MRTLSKAIFFLVCGFSGGIATTVLSSTTAPSGFGAMAGGVHVPGEPAPLVAPSEAMLVAPPATGGPILLPATVSIPTARLPDEGPVVEPLGNGPVSHLRGLEYLRGGYGQKSVGIWECSPGRWRRQIMEAEFAHFLTGHAIFTPDGGKPIEIKAGDTVWFPPNTRGIWDITETTRKTYILIGSTSYLAKAVAAMRSLVAF